MDKVTVAMLAQQRARLLSESMEAEYDAEMKKREKLRQEIEYRDAVVRENRERMAEKAREEAEQMFIADARLKFTEANPGASEGDWKRLLPKIKEEFQLSNFRDAVKNSKPEWFDAEMN